MLSYIYMKILESSPKRYDFGIKLLSFGQSERIKQQIAAELIKKTDDVLEIGCGTGTLSCLMAKKGAKVCGFDSSNSMQKIAKQKIKSQNLADSVKLMGLGVAEMDTFDANSFDKIVSTLVFSELSGDEQCYALKESMRILRKHGKLIIADEVVPDSLWQRIFYYAMRLPLLILTFILTQTTTHPIKNLEEKIAKSGFIIDTVNRNNILGSFKLIVAKKP